MQIYSSHLKTATVKFFIPHISPKICIPKYNIRKNGSTSRSSVITIKQQRIHKNWQIYQLEGITLI